MSFWKNESALALTFLFVAQHGLGSLYFFWHLEQHQLPFAAVVSISLLFGWCFPYYLVLELVIMSLRKCCCRSKTFRSNRIIVGDRWEVETLPEELDLECNQLS